MPETIYTIFRDRCLAEPDNPFVILSDNRTLTYAGALRRTAQLANFFLSIGIRPGDRIAIQAEKSVEALLTYLAALRMGAVYLPLNTAYTAAEVEYFLEDAGPTLFICRPQDKAGLSALCARLGVAHCLSLDPDGGGELAEAADRQPDDLADVEAAEDALAAILYTSGTTGRSKGAMLSHANLCSNAQTLCSFWKFSANDRLLHALPIFHTHGLFVATNITICAGSAMIFLPRMDAAELVRLMPRATVLMGVPTFYTRLLAEPAFTHALASHMRLFVSGSAPLSAETHREFSARTGHAILERYGMTETNMNTSNPYDGERVPGSIGIPLPGVEVQIADPDTGRPLPQGEVGVIEVRGPNIFQGYWRMPEKTAEEFRPNGFFITGDLGLIDEKGYFRIVGRAKDLIISGGFNIYPAEVEAELDAVPGVAESAVIGVAHPDLGEAVVAIIRSHDQEPDEAGVLTAIEHRLARFKQPRRVIFVPELPRNTMGKVQKRLLRETYSDIFADRARAS